MHLYTLMMRSVLCGVEGWGGGSFEGGEAVCSISRDFVAQYQ